MFRGKSTDEGSNFWISYADLMAGLLFVFILLIGAIVSKSIILKSNLKEKEERLTLVSKNLEDKEDKLEDVSEVLSQNRLLLSEKEALLLNNKKMLEQKEHQLTQRDKELDLSNQEVRKLNRMLALANTELDKLSNKVIIVQNLLSDNNQTLQQERKRIEDYEGKVLVLSSELKEANRTAEVQSKKMLALLNALDEKQTRYDDLIDKLQQQKAKIKSLTGIKLKVIAALKDSLGEKINIDKKSGALRLASNVLFDKGSSQLKEASKASIAKSFEEYVTTLMTSPRIMPHLDQIIIEGHTDSDGEYFYNLNLSQKRAFAVMNFLLTQEFAKKYDLQPLMISSGRAYLDPVMTSEGKEDKEASRRIEIKFRLKNQDAMEEIEKVLDAK